MKQHSGGGMAAKDCLSYSSTGLAAMKPRWRKYFLMAKAFAV
jgi:hypothetical protein